MLKMLSIFPLHILSAFAYWAFVSANGVAGLDGVVMSMVMPSGAFLSVTGGECMIIFASLFLLIEAIKASQTGWTSITNHGLSSLLFIVAFALFLTIAPFSTSVWLVITCMIFVDMMAGWSITAFAARRDFGLGGI